MFRRVFLPMMFLSALPICAQTVQRKPLPPAPTATEEFLTNTPANVPTSARDYRIGPDDLVEIAVFEAPDLGTTGRVSASGTISLPLIGAVEAAGKTIREFESEVIEALESQYLNEAHVTVLVREYASQPVSVIGAVKVPGIYQIKGQKRLLEMLSMAQGLDQNSVGSSIQVMRRESAGSDTPQTITINTEELFQNGKTELNIPIQAGDVINVLQAGSIFVVGEVIRPGEFVLRQGKEVSVLQAVALGGGITKEAKRQDCVIIRLHQDGSREEIPANLGKIQDGSTNDPHLLPNDILFVPSSKVKAGMKKVLDTTIATLSARLIYRF